MPRIRTNAVAGEANDTVNGSTRADLSAKPREAEDGARTRDPQLGKLVLYQLSYFRGAAQSSARPAAAGLTGAAASSLGPVSARTFAVFMGVLALIGLLASG